MAWGIEQLHSVSQHLLICSLTMVCFIFVIGQVKSFAGDEFSSATIKIYNMVNE